MHNLRNQVLFWLSFVFFLVLIVSTVSSSAGTRSGPFVELSAGGGVTSVSEDRKIVEYKQWEKDIGVLDYLFGHTDLVKRKIIKRSFYRDDIVGASPVASIRFGYGFGDQLVLLAGFNPGKLTMVGPGFTFFQKKTAPSLFYSVLLPVSFYKSGGDTLVGPGLNLGIGYEFWKHFGVKIDFSLGSYDGVDRTFPDNAEPVPASIPIPTNRAVMDGSVDFATGVNGYSITLLFSHFSY